MSAKYRSHAIPNQVSPAMFKHECFKVEISFDIDACNVTLPSCKTNLGAIYFYSSDDYTNLNVPKVKEFRRSVDSILEGQIRNC